LNLLNKISQKKLVLLTGNWKDLIKRQVHKVYFENWLNKSFLTGV